MDKAFLSPKNKAVAALIPPIIVAIFKIFFEAQVKWSLEHGRAYRKTQAERLIFHIESSNK